MSSNYDFEMIEFLEEMSEPEDYEYDNYYETDTEIDKNYTADVMEEYASEYSEDLSNIREPFGCTFDYGDEATYSAGYADDYRDEFPDGPEGDAAYENWLDDIGD